MFRTLLASLAILALSFSLSVAADKEKPTTKDAKDKHGKEAKITSVDAKKGTVTVAASKEAKEGTHTVKVHGGKKDVELKVKVAKKDGK